MAESQKGIRLPATRSLAEELGLSRNTVRAAYDQLIAEGFFEGRIGSGSFAVTAKLSTPKKAPTDRVAPQSLFARRLRETFHPGFGHLTRPVRYNLQWSDPTMNPKVSSAWRRELIE